MLIPLCLFLTAGIGFGFGIIVSSITTKYRDINMFVGFGIQLLMYVTPVIYSFTSISPAIKSYLKFNPLVMPVEGFKYALFGVGEISLARIFYSLIWMISLLFTGIVLFNKAERNFMDNV
jgi:lipopolysaccharide transport system permease protein